MIRFFFIPVVALLLIACSKDDMSFDIGSKYLDTKTNVRFFDTLTIHSFTVKMDSIQTSALKESDITVGSYYDPEFGRISANSYFRVSLPSSKILPNGAVYDSAKIFLVYNDYYAGDTLQEMTLNVHRLQNKIKAGESNFLYNTTSISTYPDVLGSRTFKPRPHRNDTIWIRLDNDFGQETFNLLKNKEPEVDNITNFYNYLKGFRLSGTNTDQAIIGFKYPNSSDSHEANNPALRLYYHYTQYEYVKTHIDFPVLTTDFSQFNQFMINDEVIGFPGQQAVKIPASQYDDKSYVMAGLGVVTRFEIPYLKNLNSLHENVKIIKAILKIEPARNTYKKYELPKEICLYNSDNRNRFLGVITDGDGYTQYANLVIDYIDQIETWYTFDITSFMQAELSKESDEAPSLLLTIPPDNLNKTVERLVLGSQMNSTNKVTLKVYYMFYE